MFSFFEIATVASDVADGKISIFNEPIYPDALFFEALQWVTKEPVSRLLLHIAYSVDGIFDCLFFPFFAFVSIRLQAAW